MADKKTEYEQICENVGLNPSDRPTIPEIIRAVIFKYPDAAGAKEIFRRFGNHPHSMADYISDPEGMRADRAKNKAGIKTCFPNLNDKIDGIRSALYVIAAASSVGKTTFCLQLADHLAADGEDVIYFSMEQSAEELAAKSIARTMIEKDFCCHTDNKAVRDGARTPEILEAERAYCEAVGDRMNIVNIGLSCTCEFIEAYTAEYIAATGKRPCVFIDYLQLIAPDAKFYGTTKEMMDSTVKRFKQISMRFNIPVFLISSVNRTSYYTPLSMESIKESGGIEYTADYIFGLQPAVMKTMDIFNAPTAENLQRRKNIIDKAKETPEESDKRYMNLTSFKGRGGNPIWDIYFNYYPAHDYFERADAPQKETPAAAEGETISQAQRRTGKKRVTAADFR